ncbi:MAG: M20/M25/M40 family metallo-hydrolase [Planctomycetes bacterium]|nr:M20/M25/M40 family metallo-hydrolase [Planctomycetota bacterium]
MAKKKPARSESRIEEGLDLLQTFVAAHGPGEQEDEVRAKVRELWGAAGLDVLEDDAGNLYTRLGKPGGEGPRTVVMSHMDEIAMLVSGVDPDGRLRVTNLGGALAWKYGEGPVDILLPSDGTGEAKTLRAILSVGSTHTTVGALGELNGKRALTWDLVRLDTGFSAAELERMGIGVGCRAVVARERKKVERIGRGATARVGCFAFDDRAGLAILTLAARRLAKEKLSGEVYFGAVILEEGGMNGSVRLCRKLDPEVAVGVDTSPSVPESPLKLDGTPSVWIRERSATHSMREVARLDRAAAKARLNLQRAIYPTAASDAGAVRIAGLAGRAVTLGIPRDNSHGFEIAHPAVLANTARVLEAYLLSV